MESYIHPKRGLDLNLLFLTILQLKDFSDQLSAVTPGNLELRLSQFWKVGRGRQIKGMDKLPDGNATFGELLVSRIVGQTKQHLRRKFCVYHGFSPFAFQSSDHTGLHISCLPQRSGPQRSFRIRRMVSRSMRCNEAGFASGRVWRVNWLARIHLPGGITALHTSYELFGSLAGLPRWPTRGRP